MRFRDLLLEYDRHETVTRWRDKLRAAVLKDRSISDPQTAGWIGQARTAYWHLDHLRNQSPETPPHSQSHNPVNSYRYQVDRYTQEADKGDERVMRAFEVCDPTFMTTKNHPYVTWMIQRYCNGGIQRFEDMMSKVKPWLVVYHRLKTTGWFKRNPEYAQYADIGRFKGLADFGDFMMPIMQQETESESAKRKIEDARVMKEEVTVLLDNATLRVSIPETKAAAILLGRNTQWCTAATDSQNYFDSYNRNGRLYVVLEKKTNTRWQLHFGDAQFMDERDQPITWENFPMAAFDAIDLENLPLSEKWATMTYDYDGDQIPQQIEERIISNVSRAFMAALVIASSRHPKQVDFLLEHVDQINEGRPRDLRDGVHIADFGSNYMSFLIHGMGITEVGDYRDKIMEAMGAEDLSVILKGAEYERLESALHRNIRFMSVLADHTHAHVIVRDSPYQGWTIDVLSKGRIKGHSQSSIESFMLAIKDKSETSLSGLELAILDLCRRAAIV